MSNPNNPEREAWLRGEQPAGPADDFARHAARGRQELADNDAANDLLQELDGLLAARFGETPEKVNQPADSSGGAAGEQDVPAERRPPARIRRLRRLYAAAAAILLLIAAGSWWASQRSAFDAEAVFAETFTPYANDLSGRTMGGSDTAAAISGPLAAAMLAYDRRDYAEATDAFAAHFLAPPASLAPATAPQIQLYYGISQLGANQPAAAMITLEALKDDADYGHPANWYRALALLRNGQTARASSLLREISLNNNSPFSERARSLLANISL